MYGTRGTGYLNDEQLKILLPQTEELSQILGGIRAFLKRTKE